jgi:hypothetical protein
MLLYEKEHARLKTKYSEIIADNLQQSRLELGLCLSDLIPRGERSGLQTLIAVTESVSLCVPMKS